MNVIVQSDSLAASEKSATRLTERLQRLGDGYVDPADQLFHEILPELHQIAARELGKERNRISFTPSDLIDETWVRSLHKGGWKIDNRAHFYAIAAKAMRRVLVDLARRRVAQRRNSGQVRASIDDSLPVYSPDHANVVEIGILLEKLDAKNPGAASVVDMHYIAGYTHEEIADRTGLTLRQVRYLWQKGSNWLKKRI